MRKIISFLALPILFVMTGCFLSSAPQVLPGSPEDLISKGFQNLVGVSSYNFELNLDGVFDVVQVSELMKISVNGILAGQVDSKLPEDPKLSLSLSGSGSSGSNTPETLVGELKLNKENLYFKVTSLPSLGEAEVSQELLDQFAGKWWQVPVSEGTYTKDNPMFSLSAGDEEDVAARKELLEKYSFFKNVSAEGTVNVRGEDSYKFSAELNKDGVKGFITENRELGGEPLSAEELEDLDKMLNSTTFTGFVYVGTKTERVNRVEGDLFVKDVSGKQVQEGNFDVSFTMWDFNKPVSLEIPSGAELFNPFMLLGGPTTLEQPTE
ncbi:MAG: hypothetical protein ABH856_03610 [Patescibacteria group bacterium]